MTANPDDMAEEYIVECLREGRLLNITDINESDSLSFGEGPVYTHFGGIEQFQYRAFVEAFVWTRVDQEEVLKMYDMHRDDAIRQRP